jgi:hypothetical protein
MAARILLPVGQAMMLSAYLLRRRVVWYLTTHDFYLYGVCLPDHFVQVIFGVEWLVVKCDVPTWTAYFNSGLIFIVIDA